MSIRLRCPNHVSLTRPVTATVVESALPLLRVGDHVEFRLEPGHLAGQTDFAELRHQGHTYRVGNVRFLGEISDERHTLLECTLADSD